MKKILVILCVIIIISITGCNNIAKEKSYYSQFRNPNLEYSWDFNESLSGGGHTFNSTYFQLKMYNLFEEIFLLIPYEIQYKHEEGHIYHNQLLNIEDLDEFESTKFNSLNLTDHHSYRQYIISVSEGIADYYAIVYFNNSMSENYFKYIQDNKEDAITGFKQHYQGIKYVYYALNRLYPNFTELILDLGSRKQYDLYSEYIKSLN
jgi:hypothetical protein